MKVRTLLKDEETYEIKVGTEALQIELQGARVDELKSALNRAMNTNWPNSPQWMKDLVDALG